MGCVVQGGTSLLGVRLSARGQRLSSPMTLWLDNPMTRQIYKPPRPRRHRGRRALARARRLTAQGWGSAMLKRNEDNVLK